MSEVVEDKKKAPGLVEKLANRFHVEPNKMMAALKATAFKTRDPISNEQMMALLVVADQYELNPWTKEIYAFPDKHGGIVPVVGVDGWSRIINSHPEFDGMDYDASDELVENKEHKPCNAWVKCRIYRKDRKHPIEVTEYFDECYRPPFPGRNGLVIGPWQTHPRRFLRHKATIQCARLAFGFVGIFDQDEAERIIEAEVVRFEADPPRKSTSAAQTVLDEQGTVVDEAAANAYAEAIREAVFNQDDPQIVALYDEMGHDMELAVHRKLSSEDRTYIRDARKVTDGEEHE